MAKSSSVFDVLNYSIACNTFAKGFPAGFVYFSLSSAKFSHLMKGIGKKENQEKMGKTSKVGT